MKDGWFGDVKRTIAVRALFYLPIYRLAYWKPARLHETTLAAILSLIIVYAPPFLSYRRYGPLEFDDQHITPNGIPCLRKYTGYVMLRSAMVPNAADQGTNSHSTNGVDHKCPSEDRTFQPIGAQW